MLRAALVVLLAGCGGRHVAPDAALDATRDTIGSAVPDAPAVGDPCTPEYPPPTMCGSDAYCAIDEGSGAGYHCRKFCADPYNGGCPTGYHQVFTSPGYGCLCYPN